MILNKNIEILGLGTQNPGKLKEFETLFSRHGIDVKSLKDLSSKDMIDPEETGVTFLDNALIKAQYYAKAVGCPVIADDSGLCIHALDYKPGVYTKRFFEDLGGYDAGFKAIESMISDESHAASMHCVLVIAWPDGHHVAFEGICEGSLVFPARYGLSDANGFGVDPIFQPNDHDKTFAEDLVHKHNVSHRTIALGKLATYLSNRKVN